MGKRQQQQSITFIYSPRISALLPHYVGVWAHPSKGCCMFCKCVLHLGVAKLIELRLNQTFHLFHFGVVYMYDFVSDYLFDGDPITGSGENFGKSNPFPEILQRRSKLKSLRYARKSDRESDTKSYVCRPFF